MAVREMSDFKRAMTAKEAVARRIGHLAGVAGVGVDVRAGGDFGVRVNLAADTPPETLEQIPDRVDSVEVRTRVVGPFRTE